MALAHGDDAVNPYNYDNNVEIIRNRFEGFCPHFVLCTMMHVDQRPFCYADLDDDTGECPDGRHELPRHVLSAIRFPPNPAPLCMGDGGLLGSPCT